MLNLFKAEFYKLKTSKVFYILVGLMVLQSIACPLLFSGSYTGKRAFDTVLASQQYIGLIIIIGLLVGIFIGGDFDSGFIKNYVSFGHSRRVIVIVKTTVVFCAALIINSISPILITIINSSMNGYGEVFTMESFTYIAGKLGMMSLVYLGLTSIAIPVVFLVKRSDATIVIFFFIIDSMSRFGSALALRSKSFEGIYNNSIFGQSYMVMKDNLSMQAGIKIIFICLATIMIAMIAAEILFKRTDVK